MKRDEVPFNWPYMTGKELHYIAESHFQGHLAGDGSFTKYCHTWLEERTGCSKALLTHSCTAALEIAALLLDIKPGDEIIMPSYTFVSTANAFALRGGIPIFIDIRKSTLNLDERLIEAAITPRTRAIAVVHYAGVACKMDDILSLAKRYGLHVIEDSAQGVMASYKGKALGSLGTLGTYSFHETKNVISGEGGALLVNRPELVLQAEIIREKGTNRRQFLEKKVEKYTWQALGSSFLPSEIVAAFLWAQLQEADQITQKRLVSWEYYHQRLESLETKEFLRRPIVPNDCQHNAHMYYVLLPSKNIREQVLNDLKRNEINSVFHYVPLHSSPAGRRYGRTHGTLDVTNKQSECILRLPLWVGITEKKQDKVVDIIENYFKSSYSKKKNINEALCPV